MLLFSLFFSFIYGQTTRQWGNWTTWGEFQDSLYQNPIIPSDYSDIDCIRVGDDYYAISSTFQFSPGMTILHSKDLVNWRICGQAVADLTQIGPELSWKRMNRYARGIWAGTIRYHQGRFYIFFGTPDEGFFMTSASNPEGPWEPLHPIMREAGWDDCSVLFDDNGDVCFIGTHFADNYKSYIYRMSPDAKSIDKSSAQLVNEGNGREASKLIKVNGWYYLVFSEYKPGIGRYVLAKRSRNLFGPYEEEKQLALPSVEAMEPNQGGLIDNADGNWYFLTHHGSGDWAGRQVSLLPVTWIDGWPIIGEVLPEGIGTMAWTGKMPEGDSIPAFYIARSDDFDSSILSAQWQWNYQPRKEMFSLDERPGWLRLKAFTPLRKDTLLAAGNTLTQRSFRTTRNEVTIKLDLSGFADGQKAGLCHFSQSSSSLGISQKDGVKRLEYTENDQTSLKTEFASTFIWLRSSWGNDGLSQYYYSLDGDNFIPYGQPYQLKWGNYRGDRIGIYCYNNEEEKGYVDVDYFHYEME